MLALWAFDLLLAIRLRWDRPLPLIATKILDPSLRPPGADRRPRPDEPGREKAATAGIILAATAALDLGADLSRTRRHTADRRATITRQAGEQIVVDRLLAEDCVSSPEAARKAAMTDRSARRVFDRLVPSSAAREPSGPRHVSSIRAVTPAMRRRRSDGAEGFDAELADLPPAARWRKWMLRVEAAIFVSAKPVSRAALVRLLGQSCRFDDPVADLIAGIARPAVRPRPGRRRLCAENQNPVAPAIRIAHPGRAGEAIANFVLTAIAYLQPVTPGEIRGWRDGRSAATPSPRSNGMT